MVPVLTAFETLYYSALFHTADEADARTRARHVLRILGLEKAADTWVGNSLMKRLSGGEKRRLSVGCALVGSSSPCFAFVRCCLAESQSNCNRSLYKTTHLQIRCLCSAHTSHSPNLFSAFHRIPLNISNIEQTRCFNIPHPAHPGKQTQPTTTTARRVF